jgi:HAD superfamily hydrolase (TIGR01509 family)
MVKLIAFELWDVLLKKEGKDVVKEIMKAFNVEDKIVFRRKFNEVYLTRNWLSKSEAYRTICEDNHIEPTEENIAKMTNVANKNMQSITIFPHSKELLEILKKSGLQLALVSNASNFSINLAKENTKLLELFDYNIFSFDLNVLKPDPKIFNSLLKITNIDPKEIVYIDAERKNCLVAKSLELNTIYYKDYEQLKQDLVPFGILL